MEMHFLKYIMRLKLFINIKMVELKILQVVVCFQVLDKE